jgi:predicted permease
LRPQDFFMSNLILLVACFLLGMMLRHAGRLPERAPAAFNSFIIHISLPALTLLYVHDLRWNPAYGLAAAMAWLHFALAAGFFWALGRVLRLPRATIGALMLTGGLGNTSFFGLPMIETFYGQEGLATGIIADQLGSFLVLSTLGIITANLYSSGSATAGTIIRKIVLFPPFIALLVALALIPIPYPEWLITVLKRLVTPWRRWHWCRSASSCAWDIYPETVAIWRSGWLSSCCSHHWCCTWCMSS